MAQKLVISGMVQVPKSGGGSANYTLQSAAFMASVGGAYALDTSAGSFDVTLPETWAVGAPIAFMDAFGTWIDHPPTFLRNGHKIEGAEVNFTDSAQGTFLTLVNVGEPSGIRVLESGAKPHCIVAPTISGGTWAQTSTNGTWVGNPTAFVYQWQQSADGETGWADISGATAATINPTGLVGDYLRLVVTASNANGFTAAISSNVSAQLVQPSFPSPGPLAYWRLDEQSGVRADATGNGYDLSDNNGVGFAAGKIGTAAVFDTTNYLSNPALGPVIDPTAMTIAGWINPTDVSTQRGVMGTFNSDGWCIQVGGSIGANAGIFIGGFAVEGGYTSNAAAAAAVPVNTWTFFAVRINGDVTLDIFTNDAKETLSYPTLAPSTGALGVGCYGLGGGPMDGSLDEIGVWNRPLSDEEIAQLYNGGDGVTLPG